MGATHFLMKTLPRVAAEMALHVLAYYGFPVAVVPENAIYFKYLRRFDAVARPFGLSILSLMFSTS
jgi:hypothetical protein